MPIGSPCVRFSSTRSQCCPEELALEKQTTLQVVVIFPPRPGFVTVLCQFLLRRSALRVTAVRNADPGGADVSLYLLFNPDGGTFARKLERPDQDRRQQVGGHDGDGAWAWADRSCDHRDPTYA